MPEPPTTHYPPAPIPITRTRPSIALFGTIDTSSPLDWRTSLSTSLSHLPISILNPARADWDSSWVEDISDAQFKSQVEWEMRAAEAADVIVLYFAPPTPAPVSMLELGLYAGTGKVVVCCRPGFAKAGNVQVVCARFAIPLVGGLEELGRVVEERVARCLGQGTGMEEA